MLEYDTGREDECETAAEIYQCGRDANLPITDQIYITEKGNATIVYANFS
jgi:hypothetical protein